MIKNKPEVNEVVSDEAMMQRQKKEIQELKRKISAQGELFEEKSRLHETQEQKIKRLEKMILVSSGAGISGIMPSNETTKAKYKRRQTWCPGMADHLPLLRPKSPSELAPNIIEEMSSPETKTQSSLSLEEEMQSLDPDASPQESVTSVGSEEFSNTKQFQFWEDMEQQQAAEHDITAFPLTPQSKKRKRREAHVHVVNFDLDTMDAESQTEVKESQAQDTDHQISTLTEDVRLLKKQLEEQDLVKDSLSKSEQEILALKVKLEETELLLVLAKEKEQEAMLMKEQLDQQDGLKAALSNSEQEIVSLRAKLEETQLLLASAEKKEEEVLLMKEQLDQQDGLKAALSNSEQEVVSLRSKLEETQFLLASADEKEEEIVHMKTQLDQQDAFKDSLQKSELEISSLKAQLEEYDMRSAASSLDNDQRVFAANDRKRVDLEDVKLESEVKTLQGYLDEVDEELQFKNRYADLQANFRKQQAKIKNMEAVLESKSQSTRMLQTALLDERNHTTLMQKGRYSEMLAKIQNLEGVITSKEQTTKEIEDLLKIKDAELQRSQAAYTSWQEQQDRRLQEEITRREEEILTLRQQLENAVESLKTSPSVSPDEINKLQEEKSQLDQTNQKLTNKIARMTKVGKIYDDLRTTCSQLEQDYEDEKAQHQETKRKLKKAERSSVDDILKTHRQQVAEKNLCINQLETDLLRGTDPLERNTDRPLLSGPPGPAGPGGPPGRGGPLGRGGPPGRGGPSSRGGPPSRGSPYPPRGGGPSRAGPPSDRGMMYHADSPSSRDDFQRVGSAAPRSAPPRSGKGPNVTTSCTTSISTATGERTEEKVQGGDHGDKKGKAKPRKKGPSTSSKDSTRTEEKVDGGEKKGKAKPRKKAPARPEKVYTEENALEKAVTFFSTSLSSIKDHPVFNCGSAAGAEILTIVTTLLILVNCTDFKEFCNASIIQLWVVLTSSDLKSLKPEAYEGMWTKFHEYRLKSACKWSELLDKLNIKGSDHASCVAYQYLIQSVFGLLIKDRNEKDLPTKNPTACTTNDINKEEEKVLRYVCGYIPFALLRKYRKQKNSTAKIYCQFLECWMVNCIDSGKTFLNYTKEWIEAQDRGGLFQVSDDVYLFFRSIEMVSRLFLTTENLQTMSDTNINIVLHDKISSNFRVQTYWCSLVSGKLSGDLSKDFLETIIKFYIKLRCKAFLKVYLDIQKTSNKQVSKKGEKALRKDL